MLILIVYSFIAGIVTILSPCILPILPVVLSGSLVGGRKRAVGVVIGFVGSFTFITLFLTILVRALGISPDILRVVAIVIILVLGVSYFVPSFRNKLEMLFSSFARFGPKKNREGFAGGILVGISIGLVWTPCVGPILASVIALTLSGVVTKWAVVITGCYALGTALPMFLIIVGGQFVLNSRKVLVKHAVQIQKVFGLIMILTAIALFFNLDRKFQTFITTKFPDYGVGLTQIEDNKTVKDQLENLGSGNKDVVAGKPMYNILQDNLVTAPEIIPGGAWFNSEPLKITDLRGKVVLVDFWTYTCINCIRTLPYVVNWYEKYKDRGLVVIGVHTPEFEFEKLPNNVQKAIKDFKIEYPVVQDNNYATWNAYANQYWPAKYLISKEGKVAYTHFGEGNYDETEQKIQELLSENSSKVSDEFANPTYQVETGTPETYLGSKRMAYFATPDQLIINAEVDYKLPSQLTLNTFGFGGKWTVFDEYANSGKDATLLLRYSAKNVFLVMRSSSSNPEKVRVFLDGEVVDTDHSGEDVKDGSVTVETDRLYKLIHSVKAGEHLLKLEFPDGKVEVFAFTFG